MLVLSRKRNQQIVIDEKIVVTVVEIRGDKVRLGIEAPRERSVHRHEVWQEIQKGNPHGQEATGVGSEGFAIQCECSPDDRGLRENTLAIDGAGI